MSKRLKIILLLVVLGAAGFFILTRQPQSPEKHEKDDWCRKNPAVRECDPTKINTLGWEDSPYISPDGNSLYFMYISWNLWPMFQNKEAYRTGLIRPGHHENTKSPWHEQASVYVATKQNNGSWSAPERVFEGCCAMTHDGKTFYFQKQISHGNNDIFAITRRSDGSWEEPVNLGSAINSSSVEDNPHISRDEKTIYWSSERSDGFGQRDLWYSIKQADSSWSQAKNMGPIINTIGAEDTVWVSADNKRAYFTNEYGLVMSEFINGAWGAPQPLKFPKPIFGVEPSLPDDEKTIYFEALDDTAQDFIFYYSQKQPDGAWSLPIPID